MENTAADEPKYLSLSNLSGNKAKRKGLYNKNHVDPFPFSPPHPNVRSKFNLGIWASAEDHGSASSFVGNGKICGLHHHFLCPAQEIGLILQQGQRKAHVLRAFLRCSPYTSICLRWNKSGLLIMTRQSLDYPDMWRDRTSAGKGNLHEYKAHTPVLLTQVLDSLPINILARIFLGRQVFLKHNSSETITWKFFRANFKSLCERNMIAILLGQWRARYQYAGTWKYSTYGSRIDIPIES